MIDVTAIATKAALTRILKLVADTLLPGPLASALDGVVCDWVKTLPSPLDATDPKSVFYGLQPDAKEPQTDEAFGCWTGVYEQLGHPNVPSAEVWYDSLKKRWDLARAYAGNEASPIFAADAVVTESLLSDLAKRLEAVCVQQERLFRGHTHHALSTIMAGVQSLQHQMGQVAGSFLQAQTSGSPSSSNLYDNDIDLAKARLDQHDYLAARGLLEQMEKTIWDKLSDRQRYKVLALQANTHIKEGQVIIAGNLLLRAKSYQPTDEKACINEALGLELLSQAAQAHALADELIKQYSHSSNAWSIWIRTCHAATPLADVVRQIPLHLSNEQEIAVAIAILALQRSAYEVALDFAGRATVSAPTWPASWLVLGLKQAKVPRSAGF